MLKALQLVIQHPGFAVLPFIGSQTVLPEDYVVRKAECKYGCGHCGPPPPAAQNCKDKPVCYPALCLSRVICAHASHRY
jgi:hypothetical protein